METVSLHKNEINLKPWFKALLVCSKLNGAHVHITQFLSHLFSYMAKSHTGQNIWMNFKTDYHQWAVLQKERDYWAFQLDSLGCHSLIWYTSTIYGANRTENKKFNKLQKQVLL